MLVLTMSGTISSSQDLQRAEPQIAPKDEPPGSTPRSIDRRGRVRPIAPGVSVSAAGSPASTLTCIVKDKDGNEYALLPNFAFGGSPKEGDPVRQPGVADGGASEDVVARLSKFTRVNPSGVNRAGGAIAKIETGTEFSNEIPDLGPITGVGGKPLLGLTVRMYGRTSGASVGVVTGIGLNGVQIPFSGVGPARYDGLIVVQGLGGPFSRAGDGGAPVIDRQGRLIGMVFAATSGAQPKSLILPIGPTLEALGVEVAGVATNQDSQQSVVPQPDIVPVQAAPPVTVPLQIAQPVPMQPVFITPTTSQLLVRVGNVILNPARIDYIIARGDEVSVYFADRDEPLKLPRNDVEASQLLQRIAPELQ
jgi:hypothetical protein